MLLPGLSPAITQGPDGFGYVARDSAEPGVVYAWEDISASATDVTMRLDDGITPFLPLSFRFPYYGSTYDRVAACTNGWVSLVDATSRSYINVELPNANPPTGIIAAYWDDLDLSATGSMLFADLGDRAVITWQDVPTTCCGGANTFQVVLHADGRLVVQYQQIAAPSDSATLGIESPNQAHGLTLFSNRPATGTANYAVEFIGPPPVPVDLDCASAMPISCGTITGGDLSLGVANQGAYGCTADIFSGREQVWTLDIGTPTTLSIRLSALGGSPELIVLSGCDPFQCEASTADTVILPDAVGSYTLVVDSRAGDEGAYELIVECLGETFAFCTDQADSGGLVEHDPWGFANGTWRVFGWLFHPQDTHDRALRIDGGRTYSRSDTCQRWPSVTFGALPGGPGIVSWSAPEGLVEEILSEEREGSCCGLRVDVRVTNTDSVPHAYEWRTYHDTAFGVGAVDGLCGEDGQPIDGGPIDVGGVRHEQEIELLPLGAGTCAGQVRFLSADDLTLRASFEMLPPHPPSDMEFLRWDDGLLPCSQWSDLVDGSMGTGCNDNSLLLIWRFPEGGGTLAPGESATASYRIGRGCAWPCGGCLEPTLAGGTAVDVGPCHDGIALTWDAAAFPAAGSGRYHVYRSDISFADAMARPRLTPPDGIAGTAFLDLDAAAGGTHYYVVQAESLDQPGCGAGPVVSGSTDELQLGPVTNVADLDPPATNVGAALRAVGKSDTTVDFAWPLAPAPASDERYAVWRSEQRPQGPFVLYDTTLSMSWTDPAAPAGPTLPHLWCYDIRLVDACGNASLD